MSLDKKIKKKLTKYKKKLTKYPKKIYASYFYNNYLPRKYKRFAKKKTVDPKKVVFINRRHPVMTDNFKPIADRLELDGSYDVRLIGLGNTVRRYKNQIKLAKAAVEEISDAHAVFVDDACRMLGNLPVREETTIVNTWHACGAFKRFGMSTADKIFGGDAKWQHENPHYRNLDLVSISSPEIKWAYSQAMDLEGQDDCIQPVGVARTDVFFDEIKLDAAKKEVNKRVPLTKGKKIILYAPTFRGRVASAKAPNELDLAAMKEALGDEYVLLIKHHPFVKKRPKIPEEFEDFAIDVTKTLDINTFLSAADICITDYSSVVFEYSLLDRPMLFFAYDKADYDDWRGFYYDYEDMTPGPVCTTTEEVIDYIQGLPGTYEAEEMRLFREKFMSACDGHATDRIMEFVFGRDMHPARLSIVVPAYNAMPELTRALDSVKKQLDGRRDVRVIVVDDGSTDGTGEEAERFAAEMPGVFSVIHLDEPSGSPAKPRNVGLDAAEGDYVFFLDADDFLGDGAIARMLRLAYDWDSDVMLVKFVGENGRSVPTSMFAGSHKRVDAINSSAIRTFSPLKLFKRSMLEENEIRFLEDRMPEDIPFVLEAYDKAKRVSIASDLDYYHVSAREAGEHATLSTWDDLDSNLLTFESVLGYIDENIEQERRDEKLMPRLFERDVKNMLVAAAGKSTQEEREHYFRLVSELFEPYWNETVGSTINLEARMVLEAAFSGGLPALELITGKDESIYDLCTYTITDDGRLLCCFDEGDVHVCADASKSVYMRSIPTAASADEDTISLASQVEVLRQFADAVDDFEAQFVLASAWKDSEVVLPASIRRADEAVDEQKNANMDKRGFANTREVRTLEWSASIPKSAFEPFLLPFQVLQNRKSSVTLSVRLSNGEYTRDVRLGRNAAPEVRKAFESLSFDLDGMLLEAFCTGFENFSFRLTK